MSRRETSEERRSPQLQHPQQQHLAPPSPLPVFVVCVRVCSYDDSVGAAGVSVVATRIARAPICTTTAGQSTNTDTTTPREKGRRAQAVREPGQHQQRRGRAAQSSAPRHPPHEARRDASFTHSSWHPRRYTTQTTNTTERRHATDSRETERASVSVNFATGRICVRMRLSFSSLCCVSAPVSAVSVAAQRIHTCTETQTSTGDGA